MSEQDFSGNQETQLRLGNGNGERNTLWTYIAYNATSTLSELSLVVKKKTGE